MSVLRRRAWTRASRSRPLSLGRAGPLSSGQRPVGLSKLILTGAAAGLLIPTGAFAQAGSGPPVPIWPGQENLAKSYGDRKVFLSPDEHSVILLWPDENGTGSKPVKMPLHNAIHPDLHVQIENDSGIFVYHYDLENEKQSEDTITNFSVVVYPDPSTQLRAELATPVKAISTVKERVGIPGAPSGGLALWLFAENQPLLPAKREILAHHSSETPDSRPLQRSTFHTLI